MAAEPGPWGICGASRRSRAVVDALGEQDGLYGVLERGPEEDRVRVVGAVREALVAPSSRTRCATGWRRRRPTSSRSRSPRPATRPDGRQDRARDCGRAPRTPVGQLVRGLEARRAAGRRRAAGDRLVRQPPRNGELLRGRSRTSARAPARRARGLDRRPRRLPLDHGRPHRPGRHGRRPRRGEPADRRPRRGDRRGRAVQPVGARGRLPRAPAGVGGRRRAARARHGALRDDEAAAGQRRPLRARLPGAAAGPRDRRRRGRRPRAARVPGAAARDPSSRRRSGRSPGSTSTATARTW